MPAWGSTACKEGAETLDELLRMEHVSKRFGDFYANRDINLSVRKGEVHTLLGENGAGKSTLMNVLIGLYQPTEGKIFLNGKEVRIDSPAQAVKLGIGMVHQHFMLVEAMTVFENIILGDRNTKGIFIDKEARKNAQIVSNTAEAFPTAKETKASVIPTLVCGAISAVIGAVPGTGGDIAAIICWQQTKNFSKHPEEFGHGAPEGIAAPEAANNAVSGGAMIPLLTLGIPGDSVTAIMLGALMMQGITPGPLLFSTQTVDVYSIIISLFMANVFMCLLGYGAIRIFSKISLVPMKWLNPIVFVFCVVGTYAINNNIYDVFLMIGAGIVGYFLIKLDFCMPPIILGLILGGTVEENLRRTLVLSDGSFSIFLSHPIALVLLAIAAISLLSPIFLNLWKKRSTNKQSGN